MLCLCDEHVSLRNENIFIMIRKQFDLHIVKVSVFIRQVKKHDVYSIFCPVAVVMLHTFDSSSSN